jgi:hypothetical protein
LTENDDSITFTNDAWCLIRVNSSASKNVGGMDDTVKTPNPELPLALLRFRFTAETTIRLPEWPASMLRGAFGHALRQLSCMTRLKDCDACPLLKTCPYPAIFAPPPLEHRIQSFRQPPAPYLIEPDCWGARVLEPGEKLCFGMTLMGRAGQELPLIVEALRNAAHRGLGKSGGTAELDEVSLLPLSGENDTVVLFRSGEDKRLRSTPARTLVAPPPVARDALTLRLRTPLRLQENGRALPPVRLTPAVLLMSAVRRAALLLELYGNGAPAWNFKALTESAATIAGEKSLRWQDWSRYSSRQNQVMHLGGVMGIWRLSGDLSAFFPALFLGQWLGIGKETVFGLGRYELENGGKRDENSVS